MENYYTKTRRLLFLSGHLLRALLLVISILAVGSIWVWYSHKDWVKKVDGGVVYLYQKMYSSRVSNAKELIDESKVPEASKVLQKLIKNMGVVNKQDRLAPIYSKALKMNLTVNRMQKRPEAALLSAKALVDFNNNDYKSWLEYGIELIRSNKREEALAALFRANKIAPYKSQTVDQLAKLLIIEGRFSEAESVRNRVKDISRKGTFQVFWASRGEQFSRNRSQLLPQKSYSLLKQQTFVFTVNDKDIVRFRLDFPEGMSGTLVKVDRLFFLTDKGAQMIDLKTINAVRFHNMSRKDARNFLISGSDPYFLFDMPPNLANEKIISVSADLTFK